MREPPPAVVDQLRLVGRTRVRVVRATCAKSSRRALVFEPSSARLYGTGYNAPPIPLSCDASAACRRDCAKICIHAEQMAIMAAIERTLSSKLTGLELVHGKFDDGELVAGGGPSCWQCSKLVLEADLKGVWLYERECVIDRVTQPTGWRFYNAVEFHWATLAACGIHNNLAPEVAR